MKKGKPIITALALLLLWVPIEASNTSGNNILNLIQDTPSLDSVYPSQNALNIPRTTQVTATFTIALDPQSVNQNTFVVNGRSSGQHTGNISYDNISKTLTFDPIVDFQPGELVCAILTTGILSWDGTPLESGYVWSFTTAVNSSAGLFSEPVDYPTGDYPYSVIAADLDGDGDNDLAATNTYSDNITIRKNNGNGTFQAGVNYSVGDEPWSVFVSDLDRDGDNDLAVTNFGTHDISILINNGNGTFQTAINYETEWFPTSITAADLDGDGDYDLAVTNALNDILSILNNNGNGTFEAAVNYERGDDSRGIAAADLDGDGDIDLVLANYVIDSISVVMNNGDGTFLPEINYAIDSTSQAIFAADLDGDGDIDLAAATCFNQSVSVLLNNGDGTYLTAVNYALGESFTMSVFASDIDGDGDLDLATVNANQMGNLSVLRNYGDGTFQAAENYLAMGAPVSLFISDINGDGLMDLILANQAGDGVSVMLNIAMPFVQSMSPAQNSLDIPLNSSISAAFNVAMDPSSINANTFLVFGSLSGKHTGNISYDAPSKTALFNPTTDFISGELVSVSLTTGIRSLSGVYLEKGYVWSFTSSTANGSGDFSVQSTWDAGSNPLAIVGADIDGDGDNDLAVANENSDNVSILINNGDASFQAPVNYNAEEGPSAIIASDLDGDSDIDLAVTNYYSSTVSIYKNNGTGTYLAAVSYSAGTSPKSIFCGDLDEDGDNDLAVANAYIRSNISILKNNGNGTFQYGVTYNAGNSPSAITGGDVDRDGDIDLAVGYKGLNYISIFNNNGNGTFQPRSDFTSGSHVYSIFATDIDGDSDSDLITSGDGEYSIMVNILVNTGGNFSNTRSYIGDHTVFASDVDGDGDMDLETAKTIDMDFVSILKNDGNGYYNEIGYCEVGINTVSIFPSDLDGDGDIDLAAANYESGDVSILINSRHGYVSGIVSDIFTGLPISGASVYTGQHTTYSNGNGEYSLELPRGNYRINSRKQGYDNFQTPSVSIVEDQTTVANITMTPFSADLSVTLWGQGCPRTGYNKTYSCEYVNLGVEPAQSVVLQFVIPTVVTYLFSYPMGQLSGNTITWQLGTLDPVDRGEVEVIINIPTSMPAGTILTSSTSISTTSPDMCMTNNSDSYTETVVNSWDPNDKIADPPGVGANNYIKGIENLKYTIFFENEGTGEAVNVVVVDTLDPDLDWTTLEFGPMSHPEPCSSYFDIENGIITWTCDSIMLPANNNPPEGEGWLTFEIYPNPAAFSGTKIDNRAAIKFDYNPWIFAPMTADYLTHTIDSRSPQTSIAPLPMETEAEACSLVWSGNDPLPGSGNSFVEIYSSDNGGEFVILQTLSGDSTWILFSGQPGHCYSFYSVGIDSTGNREIPPDLSDASTCFVSGGCAYVTGDINGNGAANGIDVSYGVNYFKGSSAPPVNCNPPCNGQPDPFYAAGDVNGSCTFNGIDITYFVSYFKGGAALQFCADCPPTGYIAPPIPAIEPIKRSILRPKGVIKTQD